VRWMRRASPEFQARGLESTGPPLKRELLARETALLDVVDSFAWPPKHFPSSLVSENYPVSRWELSRLFLQLAGCTHVSCGGGACCCSGGSASRERERERERERDRERDSHRGGLAARSERTRGWERVSVCQRCYLAYLRRDQQRLMSRLVDDQLDGADDESFGGYELE
jgi:hypothetical protein